MNVRPALCGTSIRKCVCISFMETISHLLEMPITKTCFGAGHTFIAYGISSKISTRSFASSFSFILMLLYLSSPVPAGIRCPMITFSLRPKR